MHKILVSMIPRSSFFKNVRSEVKASHWNRLRKACYKKAKYRCEICNGKGPRHPVECHEVWHYDHKSGIQKLKRLVALCPSCHQVKHFGLSQLRGLADQCISHMMKVNKWSEGQCINHINEAGKMWDRRNLVDWELDLSNLH